MSARLDQIRLRQIRRGITPKLRAFILGLDGCGTACAYCGFPATEVDHIVPVSIGGGVALANLAPACTECNSEKRDRTPDEWAAERRERGLPWPIPRMDDRLADFIRRHGITPEVVGDSVTAWIRSLPGGYAAMRAEIQRARNIEGGTA